LHRFLVFLALQLKCKVLSYVGRFADGVVGLGKLIPSRDTSFKFKFGTRKTLNLQLQTQHSELCSPLLVLTYTMRCIYPRQHLDVLSLTSVTSDSRTVTRSSVILALLFAQSRSQWTYRASSLGARSGTKNKWTKNFADGLSFPSRFMLLSYRACRPLSPFLMILSYSCP
jgi:hypothetical protein